MRETEVLSKSASRSLFTWGLLLKVPELELIQSHMAQKPVLRGEVGCACVAREVLQREVVEALKAPLYESADLIG